jgi:hypothetical protein
MIRFNRKGQEQKCDSLNGTQLYKPLLAQFLVGGFVKMKLLDVLS